MDQITTAMDGAASADGFVPMKLVLQPSGMAVELTRTETVVGRHMSCDLRLPLPDVSRRHCRFAFTEGAWHVFDLDSLNGVMVNQQRVPHAVIRDGDEIRLGGFTFGVEIRSAALPIDGSGQRVLRSIADALETQKRSGDRRQAS